MTPIVRCWIVAAAMTLVGHSPPAPGDEPIQLEIRVFSATEEVTDQTIAHVYPAGKREAPIELTAGSGPRLIARVPPGLYDVQTIRHRQGQVLNVRWAERLVVMRYPDEDGAHLEVINFQQGFGALQIRAASGSVLDPNARVAIFPAGDRSKETGKPVKGEGYTLFVVPAGRYDIALSGPAGTTWWTDVEVPLDRTRLKRLESRAP